MTDTQKQRNQADSFGKNIPLDELKKQLKALIVEALVLEDVKPDEIDSDEPLFVEGLGLDSIDALELAIAIEARYKVKFSAEDEENRKIFATVTSLADYISTYGRGDLRRNR